MRKICIRIAYIMHLFCLRSFFVLTYWSTLRKKTLAPRFYGLWPKSRFRWLRVWVGRTSVGLIGCVLQNIDFTKAKKYILQLTLYDGDRGSSHPRLCSGRNKSTAEWHNMAKHHSNLYELLFTQWKGCRIILGKMKIHGENSSQRLLVHLRF